MRKRLALTMGDPAGIGPEIIAKALRDQRLASSCLVIGDAARLALASRLCRLPLAWVGVAGPEEAEKVRTGIPVVEAGPVPPDLPFGRLSAAGGEAAFRCLSRALDLALAGQVAGIVTAPLNKEALHLAGHHYPGHTEILAERCGVSDWVMSLSGAGLNIFHATAHIPLAEVPSALTTARILRALELGHEALARMGAKAPRLAVAGLNPHAGESGLLGGEEGRVIAPAVAEAKGRGWDVTGPVSPDTVFSRHAKGDFDGVVAMYHDQGHIPFKLLAFETGVQFTLGLPLVRTSVDHGTAFDIAGKGVADHRSLDAAIALARQLC